MHNNVLVIVIPASFPLHLKDKLNRFQYPAQTIRFRKEEKLQRLITYVVNIFSPVPFKKFLKIFETEKLICNTNKSLKITIYCFCRI